jgi:hypothetical protein
MHLFACHWLLQMFDPAENWYHLFLLKMSLEPRHCLVERLLLGKELPLVLHISLDSETMVNSREQIDLEVLL